MNLDQERARTAFSLVLGLGDAERGDFLGSARKLPFLLQTNGLLAAWAHLLAKAGADGARSPADHRLAAALQDHLSRHGLPPPAPEANRPHDALRTLWQQRPDGASGRLLRQLTAEAIRYSVWLKRAAEALCPDDDGTAPPGEAAR